MKQEPIGRIVVLVLSMAVVAAACGDDDTAATSTSTVAPATTTVAPATTTVAPATTTVAPASTSATTASPVPEETETVSVFFSTGDGTDCSQVDVFERQVPVAEEAIRAAFDELVAGPTDAEQAAGASSLFSDDTTGTIGSVTFEDGLLVVDFEDVRSLMPNASTSCGSEALLAQLNATAFQNSDVLSVRYEIAGDCDAFANWLQRECQEFERAN